MVNGPTTEPGDDDDDGTSTVLMTSDSCSAGDSTLRTISPAAITGPIVEADTGAEDDGDDGG